MLTFREFLKEAKIPITEPYMYHITLATNVKDIISKGKLVPPYHIPHIGHTFEYYSKVSKGRIHFSDNPEKWIYNISGVSDDDIVIFRMKRSVASTYKWNIPEYLRRVYSDYKYMRNMYHQDLYITKPVPLSKLQVLSPILTPRGMIFEPAVNLDVEIHPMSPADVDEYVL